MSSSRARIASLALAALAALAIAAPRLALADANEAAQHVAKAEKAEQASDWRAAIASYEKAYRALAHPNLLVNIADNYERLGRHRDAASYLGRFARDSENPTEKDRAKGKSHRLRTTAATVTFASEPAGLVVVLDGEEIGPAPIAREIEPGKHTATVVFSGSMSEPRDFVVAYAEPLTLDFHLGAKPGTLTVGSNVADAEVIIDGITRGQAPFSGRLAAGTHTVLVTAAGYLTASNDVEVMPGGREQIVAKLSPAALSGEGVIGAGGARRIQYLIGAAFGGSGDADGETSGRLLFEAGIRTPSRRWDFVATGGSLGGRAGAGIGLATRMFFRGGVFRPYARAAISFGRVDDDAGEKTGSVAGEGGIGVRFVGKEAAKSFGRLEYFVEVNVQLTSAARNSEEPAPVAAIAPLAAVSLSFPFTVGITWRFGG